MSYQDHMTIDERRKYLHKMRIRYWQVQNKGERSRLLNEMEAVLGLHRQSLLRLIHGGLARKPRRKQRGKTYGAEVEDAVRRIAHSLDYPCAERLQPNLVWMAKHLARHSELEVNEALLAELDRVSVSTVRRMIPPSQRTVQRIAHRKAPRAPRTTIQHGIPMRRIPWQQEQPGHFEVDSVHHCGLSASGQYVHTTQMTDVATLVRVCCHSRTQRTGHAGRLPAYLASPALPHPRTTS